VQYKLPAASNAREGARPLEAAVGVPRALTWPLARAKGHWGRGSGRVLCPCGAGGAPGASVRADAVVALAGGVGVVNEEGDHSDEGEAEEHERGNNKDSHDPLS